MTTDAQRIEQLEQQLQEMRDNLYRLGRLAEMGKLVAVTAHELSQPLLGIKAFAQIIQRSCKDDDNISQKISIIVQQAKVMESILNGLRDFTRPKLAPSGGIDASQVAADAVELFSERAKRAKVTISTKLSGIFPKVLGDRGQLQQVIVNLISNAIDALAEIGGGKLRLRIDSNDGGTRLMVADTGQGIDAETEKRLFEPFFTTKKQGEGTGLGLSICKEIIELHGGSIRLLSPEEIHHSFSDEFGMGFVVWMAPAEDENPSG